MSPCFDSYFDRIWPLFSKLLGNQDEVLRKEEFETNDFYMENYGTPKYYRLMH